MVGAANGAIQAQAFSPAVGTKPMGSGGKGLRILLVDDTNAIRAIIRAFLGTSYEYIEASNGTEALEILKKETPDLVISDVNMPGMNGVEFVTRLRGELRISASRLPVLMLTSEDVRERCLQAGASDFVSKPVKPDALKEAVGRCLKKAV